MNTPVSSMVDVCRRWAEAAPERVAYSCLTARREPRDLTFAQLDARARALACLLQEHAAPGDRVILQYPTSVEYVAAFMGCLYAEVIAVPAYPVQGRDRRWEGRLHAIIQDAAPRAVLTTAALREDVERAAVAASPGGGLVHLETDRIDPSAVSGWRPPRISRDTVAFLQYTSGTTSAPRGVVISHGNLAHQEALIQRSFGQHSDSVIVSWLPLYHDMGLIGCVLQALYAGARCVLMSPSAFLQNPLRWLQAIQSFSATTSGAPNFAYDLCVRRVREEDKDALDLSTWEVAFNGAEPVRGDTMRRFAAVFARCGFQQRAWRPCYGLAEATLMVTAGEGGWVERAAASATDRMGPARRVVSCGPLNNEQRILIVDPDTRVPCASGETGEVWISGPSVALGYWNRPSETAAVFQAAPAAGTDAATYLRTGDLGFHHDGQLFLAGRLKDVIVVRGRNYFAEDLEATVERLDPHLRPEVVACEIELDGEARLVIVQEANPAAAESDAGGLIARVREAVVREHGVTPYAVLLVAPHSIPKTPSGKRQRRACGEDVVNGRLPVLASSFLRPDSSAISSAAGDNWPAPRDEAAVGVWLVRCVSRVLSLPDASVTVDSRLTDLGMDSVGATELQAIVESELGVAIGVGMILEGPSISALAARLAAAPAAMPRVAPGAESADGDGMSDGQRAMWFLDALGTGSRVHTIARAARIAGPVDTPALWTALRTVIARHESLRASFPAGEDGRPRACLHDWIEPQLETADLSAPDEETLRQAVDAFASRPFDLAAGPLVRAALFTGGTGGPLLVLAVHHMVGDLWSLCLMLEEVGEFYAAQVAGRPVSLPPPTLEHRHYVAAQRALLDSPRAEALRAYWRSALPVPVPSVDLAKGQPRPSGNLAAGSIQRMAIEPRVVAALRALAEQEHATLYMVLLAAFQVFLHKYTGERDVVVGSPFHGRRGVQAEQIVGYLVNLLPLHADLGGNPRFVDHLAEVKRRVIEALDHQDYPFSRVVDALELKRTAGRAPLCNVVFAYQSTPRGGTWPLFAIGGPGCRLELGGLPLESFEVPVREAAFELTLTSALAGDRLSLAWNYRTDLFDKRTIRRMARHFEQLLLQLVADPRRRVSHLSLVDAAGDDEATAAGHALLDAAESGGLHDWFEEQVAAHPEAVAVVAGTEQQTYAELNARANRLARELQRRGVGREVLVGIYMERSTEVVVSILAVLKAGGAYLPIDPAYPPARVAFMLSDARVRLVLTDRGLADRLDGSGVSAVNVAETEATLGPADAANPGLRGSPRQLAYVIYTSGSTGAPKGALVEHGQVMRLFTSTAGWFGFGAADVWTLFHSHAFDFSVWELWGALLHGGRLVIVPYAVSRSPEELHRLLERERVTILNQTPSAFRQLVAADATRPIDSLALRLVIFGGEALHVPSVREWIERHGDRQPRLVNMYGITETTVHVTCQPLTRALVAAPDASPIGRPIPDLQLYLLDDALCPVPAGVAGELYVGGAGVCRGYGGRPALTAARFVPDPFAGDGRRLYRSGDLGRLAPDGILHYVGRIDDQVKIRGFRVELGEIEATLRQHPLVSDCAVIARTDATGEHQLVAYVVWAAGAAPDAADLRQHAARTLADYLLPHAFVFIDGIPLTPHGKLDRRALPDPADATPAACAPYVQPVTHTEQVLCDVWSKVLGVSRVGTADNFFELGADSIRCLQVVSLARAQGLGLSVPQLLQQQTIAQLARAAADVPAEDDGSFLTPFSMLTFEDRERLRAAADVEDAYPLSTVQAGLVFHSEYEPDYVVYCVSVSLRERFEEGAFRDALAHIIRRHPLLRTSYDFTSFEEPLQLVHRDAAVPLVVEDLRHLPRADRDRLLDDWIEREKRTRFDWGATPLFRVHVHRLDEETFQFSFSHSLFDGWSTATVTTELFEIYLRLLRGEPVPSDAPHTQYREYVACERHALRSSSEADFWTEYLSGDVQGALPCWPAPPRDTLPARRTFRIPAPVYAGLADLARTAHVPLKTVFLAAHVRVLTLITGRPDVVTGVITNGRVDGVHTDRVLGMFLNAVPLRLALKGGTWRDLVRAVFAAEQKVFPFRRYPFAELQRRRGRQPIFDTAFNIINFHVYRDLIRERGLQVVDRLTSYDQTFFPLTAYFEVDAFSNDAFVHLDVNTRQLGDAQLEAIEGYYQMVLASMGIDPGSRYETTAVLRDEERDLLLDRWCRTEAPYPDRCVHELVEATARRTPEKNAVVDERGALTYAELTRRANGVARTLRGAGVRAEHVVGLCIGRSADMVVGLLGILKAAAAYLPLDPALPLDRLKYMMADSGARVLLTEARLEPVLQPWLGSDDTPAGDRPTVVPIESAREAMAGDGDTAWTSPDPSNLAYVIYTSGSTGMPKGVQVPHGALTNLLWAMAREPGFTERDVLLGVTTCSFDIAALELFLPLVTGGTLIVGERIDTAPTVVQEQIQRSGATVMQATPTAWRLLFESGWAGDKGLKVLSGGEPLARDLASTLVERCGPVWNMYGPTETTIWSTCAPVGHGSGSVRVGRPLPNSTAYLLDDRLMPVPIGATGHLYLAGAGLARGYARRGGLTAERFCPNPFDERGGSRMYFTGDLARLSPDGSIDLLGRCDQQVKIRGFRIEPEEIEAVLLTHPALKQAAVLARAHGPGDVRLVAFVAPASTAPSAGELRQFLKRVLPDYMVPASFVPLERLPVTSSNKLDRRALAAVPDEPGAPAEECVPPRTTIERRVADIWESVLEVTGIGVHQDFFELGGHSLLATRVTSRIRADFGVPLPLTALFDAPTVAGLAAIVESLAVDDEAEIEGILEEIESLTDQQVQERLLSVDRGTVLDRV